MFALQGAHNSGKTSLAKAVAEKLGIEFLETSVSKTFEDIGVSVVVDMPFKERLAAQNEILKGLAVKYALRAGRPFVADRSPFDVLGYTFADIQRTSLADPDTLTAFESHISQARHVASQYLVGTIHLLPLMNTTVRPGKAPPCLFYAHHVHLAIREMTSMIVPSMPNFISGLQESMDWDERLEDAVTMFGNLLPPEYKAPKLWTPGS